MKNERLKTVVLGIATIFMLLGIVTETITTKQLLPYLIYFGFSALDYNGKNISVGMLVLSGLMFLVNLSVFSYIDIVFWGIVFGLFI